MRPATFDIEQTIRHYLPSVIHFSLATSRDNKPWVCEVHFAYDQDLHLYFRSLTSRRHSQEIAANPNVAGNIVKQHVLSEYPTGVYFEGTAKILTPGEEQDKAAECINEILHVGDDILDQAKEPNGHQFYKITVENWYIFGKFNGRPGQKHQLQWKTRA